TYVVEGTFRHEDDHGGPPGPLPAGSVQRMTLGSGAWHSEQNASDTEPMRFIQMWILPRERGLEPSVEQKVFTKEDRTDKLLRVISPEGGDAILVHQDASVYISSMSEGTTLTHALEPDKGVYLYVISGSVEVNDEKLGTGDAAEISENTELQFRAQAPTELIMVEVRLSA
ncbi:MAG: pirin family protein, partial [Actinomycetota bacterium]|nr:pirin family protein [Actinomycetota bacterium]